MMDILKKVFGKTSEEGKQGGGRDVSHDIRIASCALLLEMSQIDDEFSDSERDRIMSILKKNFQISDEHAEALLKASKEGLDGSIDLWRFTNLINKNYSPEEKFGLIEIIWKVAYADGKLDKHEDYLVHKLAQLLRLDHTRLIEAKLKVKREYRPL